jgi:hypothetical protein
MAFQTLEQQLNEVELLRSMFPGVDEFMLEDNLAIKEIEDYISKRQSVDTETIPLISFTVSVKSLDKHKTVDTFELMCTLPREYPTVKPRLHVRCNKCCRSEQEKLNTGMNEFVMSLPDDETCVLQVIQWLQENGVSFLKQELPAHETSPITATRKLSRVWFYMHHIYSKQKRKDILAWANELRLTGFSLPGKPGVVCVEGYCESIEEYSQRLRAMNWKRITVRHQEVVDAVDSELERVRRFGEFEELNFDAHAGGRSRDYHMDLGQFYQYLESHGAGEMFSVLFGVDGKSAAS